ncbi:hypothetical protein VOLCADRAFT_107753 [Volvox carteri f. nagariensis]|uniref:Uncharacterized protein n=1 Tax=Volvox carteri f. nagariensis TaxID=3068 RepID=D8UG35_VOLCA|nr:uncharacterized protein VOLCADRAFT_107753 [Volvox carteri f. nagariensis]EFJ41282.1 hypothetical protein VOLCADRAFT_107753 [Volvox carteri f. nagariensis]|eukprot:XP_002957616.1 hypothetical protein VOLCADRAFT_107753 [Volvox carteri f. nagariensis]
MAFTIPSKASGAAVVRAASAKRNALALVRSGVSTSFKARRNLVVSNVAAPAKEQWHVTLHGPAPNSSDRAGLPQLISKEQVQALEADLDQGASIAALRRFNDNLRNIPTDRWEAVLRPVFNELCFNLESFNPAFTSCLLMVQRTIGVSDYVRRDLALKNLIQPLAGEYGMHNGQEQLKTHRELFSDFFTSLFGYDLQQLLSDSPPPAAAQLLFNQMSRDIMTGGGQSSEPLEQASYALGYNLAIEYLADYEKTWMLDSFRALDERIFRGLGKKIDWVFLEVHAEGEAEHAAIGHNAVLNLTPADHTPILRRAMADHDRDFAAFYNRIADMLEAGMSA